MPQNILLIPIFLPVAFGLLILLEPKKLEWLKGHLFTAASLAVLAVAVLIFRTDEVIRITIPWAKFGIHFDLMADHFAKFILLAAAGFQFLVALYSMSFMKDHPRSKEFFAYATISASLTNGVILSNNLILTLFFMGSMLLALYGMISLGHHYSHRTALKALIMAGLGDFCLILGVMLLWPLVKTFTMSDIQLQASGNAVPAFLLMATGAMAKAGALPFHTWIPDAAKDAPLPFMALIPAAIEKLLGIYLLVRICLEIFTLNPNSPLSYFLMAAGSLTILLAVLMALVQKDYKKLLSFHAISQVGYMILGIGTAIPIGIVGGLFHMLNHAMYKSALFLTSGSVEKQVGTTDITKLGGLRKLMPITSATFIIAALAISGVPPFNGFVSKEMVFHGAVETGYRFFPMAAWLGAILTFASFLKLGHAVYFGPKGEAVEGKDIKDPNWLMKLPMIVLATGCVLFGVYNKLPLQRLIEPVIEHLPVVDGHHLETWKHAFDFNWIVAVSMGCLALAFLMHRAGVKKANGKAYLASESIRKSFLLSPLYDLGEAGMFDIYNWFINGSLPMAAKAVYNVIEKNIDRFYEKVVTGLTTLVGRGWQYAHNGALQNYALWVLIGVIVVIYSFIRIGL